MSGLVIFLANAGILLSMSLRAKFILGLILLVAVLGGVWFLLPTEAGADPRRRQAQVPDGPLRHLRPDLRPQGAVSSVLFAGPSGAGPHSRSRQVVD